MKHIVILTLGLLCSLTIACAAQPAAVAPTVAVPTAAAPTTATKTGHLRISSLGSLSIKDVPWLMALDTMNAEGYTTEIVNFTKTDQVVDALTRGNIDIGSVTSNSAWTAVQKGATFRTIVGKSNMSFYLVTNNTIQTCQDLDGKAVGFANLASVGYIMFDKYIRDNCASIKPNILLVADSANRVVALGAGSMDGSYLEIEDWLGLKQKTPDKYKVFLDFGKQFPQIDYSTFSVNNDFAAKNPAMVQDFVRALVVADRQILSDPQVLADEIVKQLKYSPDDASRLAKVYLNLHIWDANGALTPANLKATLDFLVDNGAVPKGATIDQLADLQYLNAVLAELGRK